MQLSQNISHNIIIGRIDGAIVAATGRSDRRDDRRRVTACIHYRQPVAATIASWLLYYLDPYQSLHPAVTQ